MPLQEARRAYLLVEQVRLTTMMRQQTPMDRIIEVLVKNINTNQRGSGKELSCPALLKVMNPEHTGGRCQYAP